MSLPATKAYTRLAWLARALLLLVIGLGVGGLLLLRQDRQQATRDAEILAQALTDSLASLCRAEITRAVDRQALAGEDAVRALRAVGCGEILTTNQIVALGRFSNSGLRLLPRPQVLIWDAPNVSAFLLDYSEAPQPPAWALTTPPKLLECWEAIERDALRTGQIPDRIAEFQRDIGQPAFHPLQVNLQYLFARLSHGTTSDQIHRLIGSAENSNETTLSGVQLADLALVRALEQTESEVDLGELLTHLVSTRFLHPSFMTERILDKFSVRVDRDFPALTNRLEAVRVLWEMDQRTRAILKIWREKGEHRVEFVKADNETPSFVFAEQSTSLQTNLVVDYRTNPPVTNMASVGTVTQRWITICPTPNVEVAIRRAATELAPRWPGYFAAEIEMLGQHFGATPHALGVTHRWDRRPLLASKMELLSGSFGRSEFTVSVRLSDPELLYARQQQRLFFFGALIVIATTAAALGTWLLQKNLATQLALNEQKSNFVSSVSHELRAPIASVRLLAESLERGKVSEATKQNEYFRFIGQECRRLSSLIENVLDFSRIEQGRKQYEFEPTDLHALVEQTVKLMEPYAAERGVRFEFPSPGRPATLSPSNGERDGLRGRMELSLDGRAIQQALVNLIDNAIKHSPKGESIAVELTTNAGQVTLSVSDHGPGIPVSEHEKIFERFYRLGSELRRETQGVGIGLSIVKHIVEAHGGRVRVESEVGKGSRFTIELAVATKPIDE